MKGQQVQRLGSFSVQRNSKDASLIDYSGQRAVVGDENRDIGVEWWGWDGVAQSVDY